MSAPSDDDVRRMTLHFCKLRSGACHQYPNLTLCKVCHDAATEALRLGAKLPDLRMERGGVAYGAFFSGLRLRHVDFDKVDCETKESWARAAEAARAAP
ncbi:MAG: hypothetical protein PHU06_06340 [Gallionella sp.]|nr:hypothetical protein [Gallionella sp.]MDD4958415.1 hypothetical protein [Gallionella sp.]